MEANMALEKVAFGSTGLQVSRIGLGAGKIGSPNLSDADAEKLLNAALDSGINLIDTARGYGLSEERIGKFLGRRRSEYILSTKVGYSVPGFVDWTYAIILAGVDEALKVLRTDVIDIVHLHSCSLEMLQRGEVIDALDAARAAGKIRFVAYSGENTALEYAVSSGRFQIVQASVNFCDQRIIDRPLPEARKRDIGVIAKRPLANAPWRFSERPIADYAEEYWLRWSAMQIDPRGLPWNELALRFAAFTPGVHCCIMGTNKLDHIRDNVASVEKGALPDEMQAAIRGRFKEHDRYWISQI
jgi:aryl-alcohol dehydrogenase-like predicted oxidoreductase